MYETDLKTLLTAQGACACGFADVSDCVPEDIPGTLVNAVSFAYRLSPAVLATIVGRPSIMYFQHYRTVNTKLDLIALEVCRFIESNGYSAFPIAASQSRPGDGYCGVFPHKTAAVRAGIGSIGKNGLLLHPEYGAGIRLATVMTDMPLSFSQTSYIDLCGDCTLCMNACPAGAISGENFDPSSPKRIVDPELCSRQMKTYSDVGRGAVCGLCIAACPHTSSVSRKITDKENKI